MSKSKSSLYIVIVPIAILVAGAVWTLLNVPEALPWLIGAYVQIRNNLLATSIIPNWALYLLLLCVLYVVISVFILSAKPRQPRITSYKMDDFLGITWRWSYQRKTPVDPWCFCSECNTELVYTYTGSRSDQETELFCETCNITRLRHDGDKNYLINRVLRLIERKIRTEEWKAAIKRN